MPARQLHLERELTSHLRPHESASGIALTFVCSCIIEGSGELLTLDRISDLAGWLFLGSNNPL